MNYLIVTRSFYPLNSPRANRATELAKELVRQGHRVSVLTPRSPSQNDLETEFGLQILDLGDLRWPYIPSESNVVMRAIRAFLLKFANYPELGWAFQVARRLSGKNGYDCIVSIAAPHSIHWGVALSTAMGRKPAETWIADCGDPFMGQENSSFYSRPAFYFRWIEKFFCRRADWITVPTEGARRGYYGEFGAKLAVIPQGFRFQEYEHLLNAEVPDGRVRFAYAGHVIPGKRDPRVLIDYLRGERTDFEFHIYTKQVGLIRDCARGDPRVVVHSFIPRETLLPTLASMHFLVNFENVGSRQSPSKLIDYWLCGRPILSLKSFELDKEAINRFLSRDYSNALQIDDPDQYRIENVVSRFVELAKSADRSTT